MKYYIQTALFLWLALGQAITYKDTPELRWDWNSIDTSLISFPPQFLFGVATSEYQVSGAANCPHSQWAAFEKKKPLKDQSKKAANHYELFDEDITRIKELGVNAYRFSVEWSLVEPTEGHFDENVIRHYHNLIDQLIHNGITPSITIHHFSHPEWFEQKGAFEKEGNIAYLVRFAKKIFHEYAPKVHLWFTINEPSVYAFQGYISGQWPPAQTADFAMAATVTINLLKAHGEIYHALKSMPHGNESQIGLTHNIFQFDSYNGNLIEKTVNAYLAHIFYGAVLDFFTKGTFTFSVPFMVNASFSDKKLSKSLDFIGLNYYSHILTNIQNITQPAVRDFEIKTDMPYAIYPEGLYRAIQDISQIGVPIYITENGIADAKDNRRDIFFKRYLYSVSKAVKDGYDIRGYFYWSLMDNFEWGLGNYRFGLYQVDYDTFKRTLRNGARYFIETIKKFVQPLVPVMRYDEPN